MAKDPAFLFYPGDWLGGTMTLTRHQKGCYIDLLMAQFNNGPLSLEAIKTILGQDQATWTVLQGKFKQTESGLFYNEKLATEVEKRKSFVESRRQSRLKTDEDQVKIYLIKDIDTGFFKIGSSVNPLRRLAEMKKQKNPAITVGHRNYELYFESFTVDRSEEIKLHQFFSNKRIKGEWFKLNSDDLTYVIRTYSRTENENVIENKNVIFKGGVGENEIEYNFEILESNQIWVSNCQKSYGLSPEQFKKAIEAFKAKCIVACEDQSVSGLMRYFSNWFPINKDRILKQPEAVKDTALKSTEELKNDKKVSGWN